MSETNDRKENVRMMVVNKKSKNKNWKLSVGVAVIFVWNESQTEASQQKQTNEKQNMSIFFGIFFSFVLVQSEIEWIAMCNYYSDSDQTNHYSWAITHFAL